MHRNRTYVYTIHRENKGRGMIINIIAYLYMRIASPILFINIQLLDIIKQDYFISTNSSLVIYKHALTYNDRTVVATTSIYSSIYLIIFLIYLLKKYMGK